MNEPDLILDALEALLEAYEKDRIPYQKLGICGNIDEVGVDVDPDEFDDWFYEVIRDWPEFSGSKVWPVRPDSYQWGESYWDGEYGAARVRLLKWLIEQRNKKIHES